MKISALLFSILFMGTTVTDRKEMDCLYIQKAINVDGRLDDAEWKASKVITIRDKRGRTNNQGSIRTLWDENNLYISFQVQDYDLQAKQAELDHPLLYKDDMIEFLIDTENNKETCWSLDDIIYHINLLGQKKDDRGTPDCQTNPKWNGKAEYAIQMFGTLNDSTDIDMGYVVEISISWDEIGQKPFPGLVMGVDFAIGDTGNLFDWTGARPFRNPKMFGNLKLIGDTSR